MTTCLSGLNRGPPLMFQVQPQALYGPSCSYIQGLVTTYSLWLSKLLWIIDRYPLPPPDEARSYTLWEGVKDNCEAFVWVYFLLHSLNCMLKLCCLIHDVPPQAFIRPPMMAAFHFVVMLLTEGKFFCVCCHTCALTLWNTFESSPILIQVSVVYFPGCPGAKKTEFLTSVLDALSTDMVHAVTDPASAGRYDVYGIFHFKNID